MQKFALIESLSIEFHWQSHYLHKNFLQFISSWSERLAGQGQSLRNAKERFPSIDSLLVRTSSRTRAKQGYRYWLSLIESMAKIRQYITQLARIWSFKSQRSREIQRRRTRFFFLKLFCSDSIGKIQIFDFEFMLTIFRFKNFNKYKSQTRAQKSFKSPWNKAITKKEIDIYLFIVKCIQNIALESLKMSSIFI